ncbi:MAG: dihydrodipicolinate synthase family protein [Spirochaetales bacterium]|nr:dihydrodipicolinate synthase family protein [Spirochaetales bacterium]
MKKLFGVITAMTTPFSKEGNVDISAIEQQTDFLIEKGVNCLYPTGTTGEMFLLNTEERKNIAEAVINKANGRATVYIHTGAMTIDETIALSIHAKEAGADGIGVVTPSYFTVDDRAMIAYYKEVCEAVPSDFPVYVYVIPQLAHNDISPECMEEICRVCPNVVGVKYSYPDFRRLMAYMRCKNGKFSVVFGADDMFLPALTAGADGTVSGCSGPFPEVFVEIYKKYIDGDIAGAMESQIKANELVFLMKSGADMSIFKNILSFRGVCGGHMRSPLKDLAKEDVEILHDRVKPWL